MGKGYVLSIVQWVVIICLALGITACSKKEEAPAGVVPAAQESKVDLAKAPAPDKGPDPGVKGPGPAVEEKAEVAEGVTGTDKQAVSTSGDDGLPSEIRLLSPLWDKHTKGAVTLTHGKHVEEYKIACDSCHHIYEDGKNIWKQGMQVDKCESCHNEPTQVKEKQLSSELQEKNLKLAFHNNCVACHREVKKEKPEANAPTTCIKCHEKKASTS